MTSSTPQLPSQSSAGAGRMSSVFRRGLAQHLSKEMPLFPFSCLVVTCTITTHTGESRRKQAEGFKFLFGALGWLAPSPGTPLIFPGPAHPRGYPCSSSESVRGPAYTSLAVGMSIHIFPSSALILFLCLKALPSILAEEKKLCLKINFKAPSHRTATSTEVFPLSLFLILIIFFLQLGAERLD